MIWKWRRRSWAAAKRAEETRMADHRNQPSALAIWLGIADNTFTRQKTVKFGDASAVNSGGYGRS